MLIEVAYTPLTTSALPLISFVVVPQLNFADVTAVPSAFASPAAITPSTNAEHRGNNVFCMDMGFLSIRMARNRATDEGGCRLWPIRTPQNRGRGAESRHLVNYDTRNRYLFREESIGCLRGPSAADNQGCRRRRFAIYEPQLDFPGAGGILALAPSGEVWW